MKILGRETERSKLIMIMFAAVFFSTLIAAIIVKIKIDGIGVPVFLMIIGFVGIAVTLLSEIVPNRIGALAKKIRKLLRINPVSGNKT